MLLSRRVAAVASSAAFAVALTACDAEQVGAAAVVGGERITVAELQEHTREVVEVIPDSDITGNQAELQLGLLNRMISFRLDDQVARDTGVTISEAAVDEFIADQLIPQAPEGDLTPLLAQNWLTEETLRDAVRQVLTIEELGGSEAYAQAIASAAEELGVEVNPRYGTWDGTQVVAESGSISVPVTGLEQ
ncbi:MAG TPA: SurA N-terminal domain-containing protein [Jiangellaceae bacterium]|nr:SurA N-terminal domain-containing protein [Jiangellaceae bacterium]